ncbi:MAG: TRASH domain-containing protein [Acetobacter sp.]|nr:TRASH domain-containing protein [Acetobacter sp.]
MEPKVEKRIYYLYCSTCFSDID